MRLVLVAQRGEEPLDGRVERPPVARSGGGAELLDAARIDDDEPVRAIDVVGERLARPPVGSPLIDGGTARTVVAPTDAEGGLVPDEDGSAAEDEQAARSAALTTTTTMAT
jgi:hypothetical protein